MKVLCDIIQCCSSRAFSPSSSTIATFLISSPRFLPLSLQKITKLLHPSEKKWRFTVLIDFSIFFKCTFLTIMRFFFLYSLWTCHCEPLILLHPQVTHNTQMILNSLQLLYSYITDILTCIPFHHLNGKPCNLNLKVTICRRLRLNIFSLFQQLFSYSTNP